MRAALPRSVNAVSWMNGNAAVGLVGGEVCFFKVWPAP
jgi:hypothetical protein